MSDDAPSRATGTAVLTVAAAGVGAAVYAISRDGFVIAVWALGWTLIVWAAKRVPHARDPVPPPPPGRGHQPKPQVNEERLLRDTSHPNRWIVTRPSPWMTYQEPAPEPDETTGTP